MLMTPDAAALLAAYDLSRRLGCVCAEPVNEEVRRFT